MTDQALSDVKVVEWGTFISAPFCTKLMADMGAEVIKVEPPSTGDESRQHGPFPKDIPNNEKSGLFLYLNTNKYGVTLDPTKPAGKEVFLKLIKDADVFVQNYPWDVVKKAGLDYESLKKVNPGLVMISLSPYGLTGPYKDWKAYDINICALGGITAASSCRRRARCRAPASRSPRAPRTSCAARPTSPTRSHA